MVLATSKDLLIDNPCGLEVILSSSDRGVVAAVGVDGVGGGAEIGLLDIVDGAEGRIGVDAVGMVDGDPLGGGTGLDRRSRSVRESDGVG